MRVRYIVPVKRQVRILNHWPFAWHGGELRLIETDGFITSIQVSFAGQPSSLAPTFTPTPDGPIKAEIKGDDALMPVVQARLRRGLAYLQCQFQIDLDVGAMRAEYEPETDAERSESRLLGFSFGGGEASPLSLTYDLVTRAMMAPEGPDDPELVAGFMMAARRALFDGAFISAYRYAFLLFETLFGDGKFRTKDLKAQLKASQPFRRAVESAWKSYEFRRRARGAETQELIRTATSVDELIDHLVDMRGFYFHGQGKHPKGWRPDRPEEAETLADFATAIAQAIGADAAAPMFAKGLEELHFESAQRAGAVIVLTIDYTYREPERSFDQKGRVNFNVPGPTPTAKIAAEVAREFLRVFERETPVAALREARCTISAGEQEVFTLKVHVD
jgi:hypothetical protein